MASVPVRYGQTYAPGSIDKIGQNYRESQRIAAQQEANKIAKRNEAIEKFQGLTKVEGDLAPLDADIVEFGRQNLENMFYEGVEKDPNYLNSREFQKSLREFEMGVDTAKKLSGTTYDAHKMIIDTPVNDRFIEWDGEDIDRIQGADTVYNSLVYHDDNTLKNYTDLGFLGALNKRASDLKGVSKIDGTPEFGVVESGRRVGQEIANEFLKDPEIRGQLKVNTQGPVTTWEVWSKLDPEQQSYMEDQIWNSKKVQDAVKMDSIAGRDTQSPEYKEKKVADIMEMIRMSSLDSGQYETESSKSGSSTTFELTYNPSTGQNYEGDEIRIEPSLLLGDANVSGNKILGIQGTGDNVRAIVHKKDSAGKLLFDEFGAPQKELSSEKELVDGYVNSRLSSMDKPEKAAAADAFNRLKNAETRTVDVSKAKDELQKTVQDFFKEDDILGFLDNDDEEGLIEAIGQKGFVASDALKKLIDDSEFEKESDRKAITDQIIKDNIPVFIQQAANKPQQKAEKTIVVTGTPNPSEWTPDQQYQVGNSVYFYDVTSKTWKKKTK